MTDFARYLTESATFQMPGHFLAPEHPSLQMAGLMRRLRFSERFPAFQVIVDPISPVLGQPQAGDGGLPVVRSDTPFEEHSGQGVFCLASLLRGARSSQHTHSLLVQTLDARARWENRSLSAVGMDWFDAYWSCAVEPFLVLFDHHGVALEDRQQKSLLRLVDGYPDTYFHRTSQDFYLDQQQKHKLMKWQPVLSESSELFYPTDIILERFGHYLLISQLFTVVDHLSEGGVVSETTLVQSLREKLDTLRLTLTGNGRVLIERWLTQTQLPARADVLTCVEEPAWEAELELAACFTIDNPLLSR